MGLTSARDARLRLAERPFAAGGEVKWVAVSPRRGMLTGPR
jgi:hypothetical protein